MYNLEERLAACSSAIFSKLSPEEIKQASAASTASWDSLSTVTLFAVLEGGFGIGIDNKNSARFDWFTNILAYLQETLGQEQIRGDND